MRQFYYLIHVILHCICQIMCILLIIFKNINILFGNTKAKNTFAAPFKKRLINNESNGLINPKQL